MYEQCVDGSRSKLTGVCMQQLLTLAVSVAVSIVAIKYMRRDSNTIRDKKKQVLKTASHFHKLA